MAGVRRAPLNSGKYQGWFTDHTGRRQFFTGTRSRAETFRMARRLEDEHRQIRLGYRPPPRSADKHAARAFADVADEYLAWGLAQGGRGGRPWGSEHAYMRGWLLSWWADRLNIGTLADLPGVLPRVEAALRELQEQGRAGKTLCNYSEGLRAFCIWCAKRGYLAENPLSSLGGFAKTPTIQRRALTNAEIRQLLSASAPKYKLLYTMALCSGLRAKELRNLTVAHLDIERGGVQLSAEWTKSRRAGFQLLPGRLLDTLAAAVAGRSLGDALLYVPYHTSVPFNRHLTAAGVLKWTADGKADFHGLRHTFTTLLEQLRASEKEQEVLARHAPRSLTFERYTHASPERLRDLVEGVGKLVLSEEKCATYVHRMAAGAEGLDITALGDKLLRQGGDGGQTGTRTRNLLLVRQALWPIELSAHG